MWDERYTEAFVSYGTEPNDWLREVADKIPDGPILCLAEGEGRNAVFLAERGHDVTAVDLSEVGLENAKELADERGVALTTIVANLAVAVTVQLDTEFSQDIPKGRSLKSLGLVGRYGG